MVARFVTGECRMSFRLRYGFAAGFLTPRFVIPLLVIAAVIVAVFWVGG